MERTKSTIKLYRLQMSKEMLQEVPSDDRALLFLSSQAFNQISIMQKMLLFCSNFDGRDDVEEYLASGQSQVVLRYLVGSLVETWEMLRRRSSRKLIDNTYAELLGESGQVSFKELKRVFGKHSLLHKLRNGLAYHFPTETEIARSFRDIPDDEDLSWYASDTYANTFYLGSDKILSMQEINLTGEREPREVFESIMKILVHTANHTVNLVSCVMRAIVSTHLGSSFLEVSESDALIYDDIPHLLDVQIPFFTYRDPDTP